MAPEPDEPDSARSWDFDWIPIYFVSLLLVVFLLVVAAVGDERSGSGRRADPAPSAPSSSAPAVEPPTGALGPVSGNVLPGGVSKIFDGNRLLVAYYGTAGTGSLGVLGEGPPEAIVPRLSRTAQAFASAGRPVQPVFELIVTVAHAGPTKSGQYSSDIDRASVQRYIDEAHRYGALVVLDLQPGRANFLEVAKRWEWALADPLVGLALDPEWRMGPDQVPGEQIGSVSAGEVNAVSQWLDAFTAERKLPEKLFVVHQFRSDMVRGIRGVVARPRLAMVQHVDGFGTPRAKLEAFTTLARPQQFRLGFKVFYDEDVPRMTPAQVLRIRPQVSFVSFQ